MASSEIERLSEADIERVCDAVDDQFERQLTFTEELIRQSSLRGAEGPAQTLMAEALASRGYRVDRVAFDEAQLASRPGAGAVTDDHSRVANVVGTLPAVRATGRSLILNGHIDVVPAGPVEQWTSPPFEPVRRDDWLYGRGGGDMKAGLGANIFAVDALRAAGYTLGAELIQQSVVEEESTGNGTLALLDHPGTAEAALISEPEDEQLVRANVGVIWFRVSISGRPAHVREANSGASAVDGMAAVITALRQLEGRWNDNARSQQLFESVARPIVFNPGVIRGGDWPSSVPSWTVIDARISILPGTEVAAACAEIEAAIAAANERSADLARTPAAVTFTGFLADGYVLPEGSTAERTLAESHHIVNHSALQTFITPGYLDGRVFVNHADTPCLVYGPIAEQIHAFDERVSIESIRRVTKTIALFVAAWCEIQR